MLTSLLQKETILLSLAVENKQDCIYKMADVMDQAGFVADSDLYVQAVFQRETEGSTGIGFGVAIPHGKSKGVRKPGLAFAKLAKPIDWQSLDGSPVTLVFLIAVPEEQAGDEHLRILAAISRKLIHEEFRNALNQAKTAEDVLRVLATA